MRSKNFEIATPKKIVESPPCISKIIVYAKQPDSLVSQVLLNLKIRVETLAGQKILTTNFSLGVRALVTKT